MFGRLRRLDRLDRVVTVVLLLTLATLWVLPAAPNVFAANAAVLVLAVLKGRCIVLHFLGLRVAPPLWRSLVGTWVIAIAVIAWLGAAAALLI